MRETSKLLLAVLTLSMALSACGTKTNTDNSQGSEGASSPVSTEQASDSGASPSGEKTTIDFWYGMPSALADAFSSLVSSFNASHPDIEVKVVNNGDLDTNGTKLQAALIAGNQPTVTMMDTTQMGQYGSGLADLGAYFSEDEIHKFHEGLLKNSYLDNKFVGVPFNRSVQVLYYNKDLFQKAGLGDTAPTTWDELHKAALKISDKANGVYGFAAPVDMAFLEGLIDQFDGQVVSDDNSKIELNSDAGVKAVQLLQDMAKDGSASINTGAAMNAMTEISTKFQSGKVGMMPMSSAALGFIMKSAPQSKLNFGTAFLPAGTVNGVPTTGSNLVVLNKSTEAQKKAAAVFLKWLTNADNNATLSKMTGYMPVTKEAVETDTIKQLWAQAPQFKVPYDQLQYAKPRPMVKGYREMGIKIEDEIKKAILDPSITPKQAVDNAAAQAQTVLESNR